MVAFGAAKPSVLTGLALSMTDEDLALRVALCESSLNRAVLDAQSGKVDNHKPQWIGLFHVVDVHQFSGGVYLFTSDSAIDRHGVAYISAGMPIAIGVHIRHLYGDWYAFDWHF